MRRDVRTRLRNVVLNAVLVKCRDRETALKTFTQNVYASIGLAIFLVVWG
jgi:hypothetical protein